MSGDSKIIEEKLDAVSDLKTQIRTLVNDNEDIKLNQEELNSSLTGITHQLTVVTEALDRMATRSGTGRTEIFRRVSRASRQSFGGGEYSGLAAAAPSSLNVTPKGNRKTSLERVVKQLTDLAVTISADDKTKKSLGRVVAAPPRGDKIIKLSDTRLKRSNLMKRRESQALLEGVRKNRGLLIKQASTMSSPSPSSSIHPPSKGDNSSK